jgi:YhcN/YlaJ family sporulation lipoprotein
MNAAADNVSPDLQARIAGIVQRMTPQIQNVYVSANPDFVARMTSYMDDVRLGHPIQSFVAEFNAMVERIFPAAPRGIGSTFPTDRVR